MSVLEDIEANRAPAHLKPSDTIGLTRRWAIWHHGTQQDKQKHPYSEHLDSVALNLYYLVGALDVELIQAAYLHDVVEDTAITLVRLTEAGYSQRVVATVEAVSKRNHEANPDYVSRVIAGGADPMLVKLADLLNNTEPDRLDGLPDLTQKRLRKKYLPAIWRIESALINLEILAEEDRTITEEEAEEACASPTASPKWKKGTAQSTIFPGDGVRIGSTLHEVRRRINSGSNKRVLMKSGVEIDLTCVEYEYAWRPGSSAFALTADDYMGRV